MKSKAENTFDELVEAFKKFPGIGPRQAGRFVYYLLGRGKAETDRLRYLLGELHKHIRQCEESMLYFYSEGGEKLCPIARDPNRDRETLMIVEQDTDLKAVEKSGVYDGQYFVLGGTLPLIEKNPEKRIRSKRLVRRIQDGAHHDNLHEIIIATSATTEGDHTASYLDTLIKDLDTGVKITHLGRGLSTGTELEYIDRETIQNALQNRS